MERQDNNQTIDTSRLRIRKLTPREVFRLMDVDDASIDKVLNAKDDKGKPVISKTQAYKMAGNSIVVACLEGLFRRMFIDTEVERMGQPSLFPDLD